MQLSELKQQILNKTVTTDFKIFKYKDNTFLVDEYIKEIAKIFKYDLIYLSSSTEIPDTLLDNSLYILRIDVLDTIVPQYNNLFVICSKNNCEALVQYEIEFPELKPWQIHDYVKTLVPRLSEDSIDKLLYITQNDIYRINNECLKLANVISSNEYLDLDFKSGEYKDIYTPNIFLLINAICTHNVNKVKELLSLANYDAVSLTSLLLKNFLNITSIQMLPSASPLTLNMSDKQFNAIKRQTKIYKNESLINIIYFLSEIDYNIKSGSFGMIQPHLTDYIILNILSYE